jgi:hypothetical protein
MGVERMSVPLFGKYVMKCESCDGHMFEAPRGSNNLACLRCGQVKYAALNMKEVNTGCNNCGFPLPSGISICDNCFDDSYVEGDEEE